MVIYKLLGIVFLHLQLLEITIVSGDGVRVQGVTSSVHPLTRNVSSKSSPDSGSGYLIFTVVDIKGNLQFGKFPSQSAELHRTTSKSSFQYEGSNAYANESTDVVWTKVENAGGIVDIELTSTGLLWVVSNRKLYTINPFADKALKTETGPLLKPRESFKLITASKNNEVWIVTSSNRIFSNYPGYWKHIRIINDECKNVYDISISQVDGTPWIICNSLCIRWKKDADYWGMVYTIPGHLLEGRYLAVVNKNDILISLSNGQIKRQSFQPGDPTWARRDASDISYSTPSNSIWKLARDGAKLTEYQNFEKVWETRLPFFVKRLSVGEGSEDQSNTKPVEEEEEEKDLGVNYNLAENSTTITELQDLDMTMCKTLDASTIIVFNLTKNSNCGGVCRVNYVLIYGDNLTISDIVVKIDKKLCTSTSSSNTTCVDNLLGSTVELNYTHPANKTDVVKLCEVIIAGVKSDDYACTDGYIKSNSYCEACNGGEYKNGTMTTCTDCPNNTYSLIGAGSCRDCDLMSYASTKSTKCQKCYALSIERECYDFKDSANLLQGSDASSVDIKGLTNLSSKKCYSIKQTITRFTINGSCSLDRVVAVYKSQAVLKIRFGGVNCSQEASWDSPYGTQMVFDCTAASPNQGYPELEMIYDDPSMTYQICHLFVFGVKFSEIPADPGQYNNGSMLLPCAAGYYSKGGTVSACTPCPINQFQPDQGKGECINCISGFYTATTQQTVCQKCPVVSNPPVGCNAATSCKAMSEISAVYGNYVWATASVDETLEQPCQNNIEQNAMKTCKLYPLFEDTDFTKCKSPVSDKLDDIKNITITNETQVAISEELKETAKASETMSAADISTTSEILKNLVKNTSTINDETTKNMLSIVSSISTKGNEDQLRTTAKEMTSAVNELAAKLANQDTNASIASIYVSSSVAIIIPKDNILALSGDNHRNLADAVNAKDEKTYFSAEIPSKTVNGVEKVPTGVFYASDKLFPVNASVNTIISNAVGDVKGDIENLVNRVFKTSKATGQVEQKLEGNVKVETVATVITDIKFINQTEREDLTGSELKLEFLVEDVTVETYRKVNLKKEVVCKFYDADKEEWSTEGCETLVSEGVGVYEVKCSCNHMTSFAVLMSFSSDYNVFEEYVTEILLTASLVCLLATIVAYLPAKKMLAQRSVRINLLLVTSLIFAIITFFFMDVVVETEISENANATAACMTVGFLMNYFWLCQMAWMVLEAVVMYMVLVRVFGSHISKYMLKFNVLAWGIPLVFPVIGLIWGGRDYIDPTTCFIGKPYAYVSFYVPVIICIIFNIVIFFMVARVIFRSKSAGQVSEQQQRKRQFKSAMAVMVLLGAGWIFGFLLIIQNMNTAVLRWLFIIINCSQGICIFIFYVICNAELRNIWLQKLGIKDPTSKTTSSTGAAYRSKPDTTMTTVVGIGRSDETVNMGKVISEHEADIANLAQAARINMKMRKWIPKAHGVYVTEAAEPAAAAAEGEACPDPCPDPKPQEVEVVESLE